MSKQDTKKEKLPKGITKKGNNYYARFTNRFGERIGRLFKRLRDAKKWLDEEQRKDRDKKNCLNQKKTVDDMFKGWIKVKSTRLKKSSISKYSQVYNSLFPDKVKSMDINDFNQIHFITDFYDSLKNKPNTGEVKNIATSLVRYAFSADYTDKNRIEIVPFPKPTKKPKKVKKENRKYFTQSELEILISCLLKHQKDIRTTIVLLQLHYGCRISEVLGLTMSNVRFDSNELRFHTKLTYKDEKSSLRGQDRFYLEDELKTESSKRTEPLELITGLPVYDLLIKQINQRKKDSSTNGLLKEEFKDLLFIDTTKRSSPKPFEQSKISKFLKKIEDEIKIEHPEFPHITSHMFRHSILTITKQLDLNDDFRIKLAGHKNADITNDVYTHLNYEDYKEDINALKSSYQSLYSSKSI